MDSAATDNKSWVLFLHECPKGETDEGEDNKDNKDAETNNKVSEDDGDDEAADAEGVTLPEFLEREQQEEEVVQHTHCPHSNTRGECAWLEQMLLCLFCAIHQCA